MAVTCEGDLGDWEDVREEDGVYPVVPRVFWHHFHTAVDPDLAHLRRGGRGEEREKKGEEKREKERRGKESRGKESKGEEKKRGERRREGKERRGKERRGE